MKERIPALIAAGLLVILVIGTWWAADYAQRSIPIDPPRRVTHEPDSWANNFVMVRTDPAGAAVNRIEGERMVHYPDDDSYHFTAPRAVGQQPGSPVTVGTSKTAIMDKDGSRITMQGDAHLHRPPGGDRAALDVKSSELIVLPDQNVVYTDKPALVVQGKSTMNGKGMRYDNKTRNLQVFSATDVKISGEEAAKTSSKQPDQSKKRP